MGRMANGKSFPKDIRWIEGVKDYIKVVQGGNKSLVT